MPLRPADIRAMRTSALPILLAVALLGGCDALTGALGIESPEKVAANREGEGKAIGGACRHAGRAIEDCYGLNKKADKAAVFAGWREMNDYMRENKIDAVAPQVPPAPPTASRAAALEEDAEAPASDAKRAAPAKGRNGRPQAS